MERVAKLQMLPSRAPARPQAETPDQVYRRQVANASDELAKRSINLSERAHQRILAARQQRAADAR